MRHSTLSASILSALFMMLTGSHANAASGDSAAHAQTSGTTTASPALAASAAANDSGLATEDASRANEQQLLGLPRVPKDTNLSAPDDADATNVKRVALHRSASTRAASTTKPGQIFANPFPSSIYPNGANNGVYRNPW